MAAYKLTLKDIVYKLSQNKKNNQPGAIVFLGAGASFTAGIPLAADIIKDIRKKFIEKPSIESFFEEYDKTNAVKPEAERDIINYYELMQRLDSDEIKALFKVYVNDAKLNVAHIYLASMVKAGYVDYVVTVNFDNLMQRALALYGIFPSVHDLTTLKEKVMDVIDSPAVIHVHGQYNGSWQLNRLEELNRVKQMVQHTFDKISQNRTWIVAGYSGEDPVFDTVFSSTKFGKKLYWICYKDNTPAECVVKGLLKSGEYNAERLNGYDADSFFMKLHNELKIDEPNIYKNPFTMLDTYLENVIDIDGEEFKGVNQRLEISIKRVKEAISLYDVNDPAVVPNDANHKSDIEKDNYVLKLSEIISSKGFDKLDTLYEEIKINGLEENLKLNISDAYFGWGYELEETAKYEEAIKMYQKAIDLNKGFALAYNNSGTALSKLRKHKEAIPFYKKAIEINPENASFLTNLGISIYHMSDPKGSIIYFQRAIQANPQYARAYNNLGSALSKIGKREEALDILQKGENIQEGSCLYNLSCAYALAEKPELSLPLLEKYLKNEKMYYQNISRTEILDDPDLDNIKYLPEFERILDTYKPA